MINFATKDYFKRQKNTTDYMEVQRPNITEQNIGRVIGGASHLELVHEEEKLTAEDYPLLVEAIKNDILNIGKEIRNQISKIGRTLISLFKEKEPAEVIRDIDFTRSRHLSPLRTQKPTTFVDFKRGKILPPPSKAIATLIDDKEDDAADWR
ncbi:hypothetical protein KBC97_00625 [Candidatus Gracilibacteria bacterium]|nr:hypothetical protein [Candidatus Gracilibacteria bacterium]